MIQIESIHIEELRGIRDLTLNMSRSSFVISGPNGSGKSGVVDAIQFALTGEIARLTGVGTGDLKLSDHGPHVDRRSDPAAAFVKLDVFIPHLSKSASITRSIKKPNQPTITPDEPAVNAVFDEIAQHPEVTLSRREIIKFILTEASQRSREVQSLLKLDDIDQLRATLKTTENKLTGGSSAAKAQEKSAAESLQRHFDLPELRSEDILEVVNKRRVILGVEAIQKVDEHTSLSEGISAGGAKAGAAQSKDSALRDIDTIISLAKQGFESSTANETASAAESIARIEANAALFESLKKRPFIETGLSFVDGPECPLCDKEWEIDALRAHLSAKLEESKEAQAVRDSLDAAGRSVTIEVSRLRALIAPLLNLPEASKEFVIALSSWSGNLLAVSQSLATIDGVIAAKEEFLAGWSSPPEHLSDVLARLREAVSARPDESTTVAARDFLVLAEERWSILLRARREALEKESAAARGKFAYKTYCELSESALTTLYEEVESDFAQYYRFLNQDDEAEFKAKFEPAEGKLGLLVDFYQRGMFPPSAYHSEGHQDGMGVCLYLALMKRVLADSFTFAVLDDVVMSVDAQHRKQFCKLLKIQFPKTQFVVTTHDQVWARQMRSEGLVDSKSSVAFHSWSIDSGPVLDEIKEVWDRIDDDLSQNEVPTAAARLRQHLEYVATDLADELGAKVHFRADGGYDKGELLSAVISRQGDLLKKAEKAAKSWNNEDDAAKVEGLQKARASVLAEVNGEDWVINKAVHYNEWADLSKEDFRPVVAVFKKLLHQFRCDKCNSWAHLVPRNQPIELRCLCGSFRLNLNPK